MKTHTFNTNRLQTAVRLSGPRDGDPLILVHGNVSSSRFYEELMAELPERYRIIAPDLRGFGDSETKPIDATRGVRDFSDDLHALVNAMKIETPFHLLGWSMGGGVVMQYAIDHPEDVASLTLIAPLSPYGFGGTKGENGELVWADGAGSGGGTGNPAFVERLARKDRNEADPMAPRNVMNNFYFKPPFQVERDRAEAYVASMNTTVTGEANYPGDSKPSENWPGMAPGDQGVLNTMAPTHCNLSGIVDIDPKPPILWVRGESDQIVSDTSMFDMGFLGQLGAVPGWPGAEVFPPQPMIAQTRAVFDRYVENGGHYEEEVIADAGHSPHIEQPEAFHEAMVSFLRRHS